jgi:hypothetical protein
VEELATPSEDLELRSASAQNVIGYRAESSEVAALLRMFRALRRIYDQELRAINGLLVSRGAPSDLVIAKLRGGLLLVTDADLRDRVKEVTLALGKMARTMEAIQNHHERLVGSLDDVQIRAVMRTEFLKAAHTLSDAAWKVLDEVRAVQAAEGRKAAMIAGRDGMRRVNHVPGGPGRPLSRRDDDMEDDDE